MAFLGKDVTNIIRNTIDSYVSKPNGIPGLVYSVIDKDGTFLLHHASGKRAAGSAEPMTTDTVFWIASCTKMVTAIAAMQLVENGSLAFDDGDQVEKLLPELREVMVLERTSDGVLKLKERKRSITLRMLLSHTAGFGYSFSNSKIKEFFDPVGIMEDLDSERDILGQPLVNQPGETWEYGVSMDWVGRLIEQASGFPLDQYFEKFIFAPLQLSETSFFPSPEMKSKLASLHQRNPDGTINLRENGHLLRRPLLATTVEQRELTMKSGGAGLFSTPTEYCEIIATLLNLGTHAKTKSQLLKEETVREMFKNQIPQLPNFARNLPPACKPSFVNSAPEIYPQPGNPAQGWGLSFFSLQEQGPTGRAAGTVWWSGLANLIWWADWKNGIGGMIASQILPFGDADVFTCQAEVEAKVYTAIQSNKKGRSLCSSE